MDDLDSKIKETESLLAELTLQRYAKVRVDHERYFDLLMAQATDKPAEVTYDPHDETLDLLFTPTTNLLSFLIENHPYYMVAIDGGVKFSIVDDYTWEFRLSGPVEKILALCKKYQFRLELWSLDSDIRTISLELQTCQEVMHKLEEIVDASNEVQPLD